MTDFVGELPDHVCAKCRTPFADRVVWALVMDCPKDRPTTDGPLPHMAFVMFYHERCVPATEAESVPFHVAISPALEIPPGHNRLMAISKPEPIHADEAES